MSDCSCCVYSIGAVSCDCDMSLKKKKKEFNPVLWNKKEIISLSKHVRLTGWWLGPLFSVALIKVTKTRGHFIPAGWSIAILSNTQFYWQPQKPSFTIWARNSVSKTHYWWKKPEQKRVQRRRRRGYLTVCSLSLSHRSRPHRARTDVWSLPVCVWRAADWKKSHMASNNVIKQPEATALSQKVLANR